MHDSFSVVDRLLLALNVMMRWETIVTLLAFIALWLLVRYVADPWRREGRREGRLTSIRAFMASKKANASSAPELDADSFDDDDELPD